MAASNWVQPEVCPLFAATTGVAVGICVFSLFRNITGNPEVSYRIALPVTPMAPMAASNWVRPEVYPLFAAMGVAVGICVFSLFRNITGNPEVSCCIARPATPMAASNWVRPEVCPLFVAATGVAVGICVFSLMSNTSY